MANRLANDLNYILEHTASVWETFRNQSIFITGGTGFFGSWLLESFVWANEKFQLNAQATILTRDLSAFRKKCPHLIDEPCLHFYTGDVCTFVFPTEHFSNIIHAAANVPSGMMNTDSLSVLNTITQGTWHILEFAKHTQASRLLLLSSGAVYGAQPNELSHVPEKYLCQLKLDDRTSAYAVGKCFAEHLSYLYAEQHGLAIKIARCFSFVGPYLPLDQYAIGNFIRDGLNEQTIKVTGDGTPLRSYLYAADLAISLWNILVHGQSCTPYNVGSEHALPLAEIANMVAHCFQPARKSEIYQPTILGQAAKRYVPSVARLHQEFLLPTPIPLNEAIKRTIKWYQQ